MYMYMYMYIYIGLTRTQPEIVHLAEESTENGALVARP